MIFLQESKKINPFGIDRSIIFNVTLHTKEYTFRNKQYNCEIIGDGKVHHFNQIGKPDTASVKVECQRFYLREMISE